MRVPLVAGSRVAVVSLPDDAELLLPPPPREPVADVAAAVRDALRFPLSGQPLEALVPRGGRATVVVEPPVLPLPGAPHDPRQDALASALDELARLGVPQGDTTILVAGGLGRRMGQRELEWLLVPPRARGFRGRVVVHDAEDPDLVPVGEAEGVPLRVAPTLAEADVILTVTAAETVLHGGPAALLGAANPEALRAAAATSLLETRDSAGWRLAVALERALGRRAPVIGASLVLNHPRLTGGFRGYPFDREALTDVARSPLRRLHALLPRSLRAGALQGLARELTAVAAFGGPPSVAHAEALLRGIELRGIRVERPLDAIVLPVPWKAAHQPREPVNPVTAAHLTLGVELRLWRDAFPVVDGGTAILLHSLARSFRPATQQPYRGLFAALRDGPVGERLAEAEAAAATDERALAAYRAGRACHPLQPYADWAACAPARDRLGAVVVAGARDHAAARSLGFVPTHAPAAALTMALGLAGGSARVGVLLAPPLAPLIVGSG